MTTLQQLEGKLQELDDKFPDAKLEGLAFKKTRNYSLGLNDKKPFYVNIPYRTWPSKETGLPKSTAYPSALQEVC
jgi:hypothetical protein